VVPSPASLSPVGGLAVPGRVLQVFEPDRGGVPAYVAALTRGLLERGWRVTVVAAPASIARHQLRDGGARVVAMELAHRPSPTDAAALVRLGRLCRSDVDIIHGHSTKASLLAAGASRLTGVPSVYTPHAWGFDRDGSLPIRLAYTAFERAMARIHREIVVVAESELRAAQRAGIRPLSGAVRVVHTGLQPEDDAPSRARARLALGLSAREVVVAWVGRRAAQKRPQDLPPIASALAAEGIRLIVAGWGLAGTPEGDGVLANQGRILSEDADLRDLYAAADVFVQTSAWEANPVSVLEAMRAALPVVAYGVGGVRELVRDGVSGYLVAPEAIGPLISRVVALARAPYDRARMGQAGRQRLELCFGFGGMLDAIESTYVDAIESAYRRAVSAPSRDRQNLVPAI
jgi:glycosyltransferase involved in cell wall biosynthesis